MNSDFVIWLFYPVHRYSRCHYKRFVLWQNSGKYFLQYKFYKYLYHAPVPQYIWCAGFETKPHPDWILCYDCEYIWKVDLVNDNNQTFKYNKQRIKKDDSVWRGICMYASVGYCGNWYNMQMTYDVWYECTQFIYVPLRQRWFSTLLINHENDVCFAIPHRILLKWFQNIFATTFTYTYKLIYYFDTLEYSSRQ